jgi:hypothetical protein
LQRNQELHGEAEAGWLTRPAQIVHRG